jgi:hypothetical protein
MRDGNADAQGADLWRIELDDAADHDRLPRTR